MKKTGSRQQIRLKVPRSGEGERLDVWLSRRLPDFSRSYLQVLIKSSCVTVAGIRAKPSHRLQENDQIVLDIPPPSPSSAVPEAIPLDICYEDRYILLIHKPAGVVVHPGAGNPRGTIANALVHYCRELAGVGDRLRPGIVHRLDKGTSGILIVAKDGGTHRKLGRLLSSRAIKKTYWAIVWGEPAQDRWSVEAPIGRDAFHRQKMTVVPSGGKEAITHLKTIDRFDLCSVVEAEPETGRTHQIRVHLTHSGYPVLGDAQYGGRKKRVRALSAALRKKAEGLLELMDRPALHAARLEFNHPVTGEPMTFESPLPDDFKSVFAVLGFDYMRHYR
jgi:23S rRNA pseudouridine1911/1915/1917 synthase